MPSTRAQSKRTRSRTTATPVKPLARPKTTTVQRQRRLKENVRNVTRASPVYYNEETEDEDGDWGQPSRPPARRSKKAHKMVGTKQRAAVDLAPMLSLPFDLQLEIFSWLSSKDLISLSRANKDLRKILMHNGGTRVWKLARETGGVPEPPPATSEPQWAVLLFDGTGCSECAAPVVHNIDFGLCRRVCVECKRANLVNTQRFKRDYPEYDEVLLDMIPYTHAGGWTSSYHTGVRYYWLQDIYDISKQWAKLQDAIRWRAPGARQKAAEFLQGRKDLMKSIEEGVEGYQEWHESLRTARREEINNEYRKRCNQIDARFEEMGYEMVDILSIHNTKEVLQRRPVTDRIWKRIRPTLEDIIRERRQFRIVQNRKATFKDIYPGYLKSLAPSEWPYHPTVTDAMELPFLKSVIHSQWDVNVTKEDLEALLLSLPEAITMWRETLKKELTEKTLRRYREMYDSSDVGQAASLSVPSNVLDLATFVFICSHCKASSYSFGKSFSPVWFGWDGVLRHSCQGPLPQYTGYKPGTMEICERGSEMAAQLMKEVGLDPRTATVEEMDAVGARWFCRTCASYMDMLYDWRSMVAHACATSRNHTDPDVLPKTQRLTDHELKNTVTRGVPPHLKRGWACAHCDAHFEHRQTQDQVQDHLHAMHDIEGPNEKDMIHFFSRDLFEPLEEKCCV